MVCLSVFSHAACPGQSCICWYLSWHDCADIVQIVQLIKAARPCDRHFLHSFIFSLLSTVICWHRLTRINIVFVLSPWCHWQQRESPVSLWRDKTLHKIIHFVCSLNQSHIFCITWHCIFYRNDSTELLDFSLILMVVQFSLVFCTKTEIRFPGVSGAVFDICLFVLFFLPSLQCF